MNKGAYVNQLDFVILAALEVDIHFNCNVITDSTGLITGAQGGHPDTAAGAKCTIVITPLLQGRPPRSGSSSSLLPYNLSFHRE